jgi:hypothetical protein
MFASDLKALQESYEGIYEEGDGISCEMLEEIVEELIEECVEFGYSLNEASTAVENAAILYIDEAKVTYGSDTESPEQRRERAKAKVGEKKAAARKAAVKTAVGRAKAKAAGAVAGAGIAASIAKDTARRAGRTAVHKVTYGAQKKKEEVKTGVKSLIGRGLRKAAGAVGKVAQKAAGAASRLGEEKDNSYLETNMKKRISNNEKAIKDMKKTDAHKSMAKVAAKKFEEELQVDAWDVVLEYLITNGHADTNSEALYIMSQMNEEMIQNIFETRMDPRGRPASGPMNVYAKNKPNTDPAFQAALERVRAADAKKTPEQRKAELDAYKARQANK